MRILSALVIIATGLGATAPPEHVPAGAEYAPAGEEAYSLDLELDGYVNGRMDPDRLMTVQWCTLERDAAYTFSLLMEAAEKEGVELRPIDCYRSYEQQDRAYNRRCPITTTPVIAPTVSGPVQVGEKEARVCSGPRLARAGHSNHGWGRAVDFGVRRGRALTCWDDEFLWLRHNAHRFGWVHPPWAGCGEELEEAWHWEFAGVTDPTLVDFVSIDPALAATAE